MGGMIPSFLEDVGASGSLNLGLRPPRTPFAGRTADLGARARVGASRSHQGAREGLSRSRRPAARGAGASKAGPLLSSCVETAPGSQAFGQRCHHWSLLPFPHRGRTVRGQGSSRSSHLPTAWRPGGRVGWGSREQDTRPLSFRTEIRCTNTPTR